MNTPIAVTDRPSLARAPLAGFFVAAFAISWLGTVPMLWASYAGAAAVPSAVRPLQLLMLFGPGIAAVAFAHREGGWAAVRELLGRLVRWRVRPAWYLAVLAGPPALMLAVLLLTHALGVNHAALPAMARVASAVVPSFVLYLLLNTEELAWRGFAWPRLRARFGPLPGAVILGVIWAVFHAPLFALKGGHPSGYPIPLFGAMLVVMSVIFSLAYDGSGGSVLIVHLLHQSFNAWGDVLPLYPRAAASLWPAVLLVAGMTVVAVLGVRGAGWTRRPPVPDAGGSPAGP